MGDLNASEPTSNRNDSPRARAVRRGMYVTNAMPARAEAADVIVILVCSIR